MYLTLISILHYYDEVKTLKSFGGKFKITNDHIFSSSNLLNTFYRNNTEQDRYLYKINKNFKKLYFITFS